MTVHTVILSVDSSTRLWTTTMPVLKKTHKLIQLETEGLVGKTG